MRCGVNVHMLESNTEGFFSLNAAIINHIPITIADNMSPIRVAELQAKAIIAIINCLYTSFVFPISFSVSSFSVRNRYV